MAIAKAYGYLFLDTGLMYRAVTLAAVRAGIEANEPAITPLLARLGMRVEADAHGTKIFLAGEDVTPRLRDPEVEAKVSEYSAIPAVREAMVREQRRIAARGRAVLAGRDIGTVVLPDAPLKFYFDASEDARAKRRGTQALQDAKDARHDIAHRDVIDSTRKVSPLRPADDAIVIDTTNMTLEEVVAEALEQVKCASV
jgi:cytidylate kinase